MRDALRIKGFAVVLSLVLAMPAGAQSGRSGVWTSDPNNQPTNPYGNTTQSQIDQRARKALPNAQAVRSYSASPSGSYSQSTGAYKAQTGRMGNVNRQTTGASGYGPRNPLSCGAHNQQSTPRGEASVPSKTSHQLMDYNEQVDGRTFLVHLPRSYNPSSPCPVVMVFHGLGMNGMQVRGLSAMDLTAEQNGFITVYPDAVSAQWNDGVQPRATTDDVMFVSDMLDAIGKKFRIDSRRVYACGISNGGFFVERLACELSNRIAAVGVVAASASTAVCSRCSTRRGMPIVFFLGSDDPIVPHEGQTKDLGKLGETLGLADMGIKNIDSTVAKVGGFMTAEDAVEFWAKNNSCSLHPRHEVLPDKDPRDGCKVSRDTYGGGAGGADVVVYNIEGGGHSWPGGMGFVVKDIIGRTCNDISANEILWQFFRNHSR